MSTITTKDGTEIFYKDWGPKSAQPIVFHHGWPLSGDDWDTQMLYFLDMGYRVIAARGRSPLRWLRSIVRLRPPGRHLRRASRATLHVHRLRKLQTAVARVRKPTISITLQTISTATAPAYASGAGRGSLVAEMRPSVPL